MDEGVSEGTPSGVTWTRDDLTLFVYALLDRAARVRYIGITVDLKTRARVHSITARQHYRGNERFRAWLRDEGVRMLPLERVEGVTVARCRESYWMDFYTRLGCPLFNQAGAPVQAERLW